MQENKTNPKVALQPNKPSLADQLSAIGASLKKHISSIITLLIIGVLSYSFITVNSILSESDDPEYRQEQSAKGIRSAFDQQTIDKINNLRTSNDPSAIKLPTCRINPFVE